MSRLGRVHNHADPRVVCHDRKAIVTSQKTQCVGLRALSFRTLAEALRLTRTAPLYYFGTTVGLVAAIAEHGFDELTLQLRRVRESDESSGQALKDLAMAYAEYALRHPHLYRAMHSPELWRAVKGPEIRRMGSNKSATDKAATWIQRAEGSRNLALRQFELAVDSTETTGRLEEEPKHKATSAHLLTVIVDGFLFHHFEERVGGDSTTEQLLTDLELLLDLALTGLYRRSP